MATKALVFTDDELCSLNWALGIVLNMDRPSGKIYPFLGKKRSLEDCRMLQVSILEYLNNPSRPVSEL